LLIAGFPINPPSKTCLSRDR